MPNDNVVYVSLDVDVENKVYTVSDEWTSKNGKAHFEGCYICESIKQALMTMEVINEKYSAEGFQVKQIINC